MHGKRICILHCTPSSRTHVYTKQRTQKKNEKRTNNCENPANVGKEEHENLDFYHCKCSDECKMWPCEHKSGLISTLFAGSSLPFAFLDLCDRGGYLRSALGLLLLRDTQRWQARARFANRDAHNWMQQNLETSFQRILILCTRIIHDYLVRICSTGNGGKTARTRNGPNSRHNLATHASVSKTVQQETKRLTMQCKTNLEQMLSFLTTER